MTTTPQVNLELMKRAIKKRPKLERALKILSARDRGRQDTSFRGLMRRLEKENPSEKWTFEEIAEFFDLAAEAGAGIIVGDRVNGSFAIQGPRTPRFIWSVHLQSFACAVLGKKEPARKRKDGSIIHPNGMRTPTAPRHTIPHLEDLEATSERQPPVIITSDTRAISMLKEVVKTLDPQDLTPEVCRMVTKMVLAALKDA